MCTTRQAFTVAPLLILLILAEPPQARGQEVIAADRPGLGSGSAVVDPGILQLEAGAQWAQQGEEDLYSLGQVLLRIGLSERLEIQGFGNSLVIRRDVEDTGEGFEDVALGAKLNLLTRGPGDATVSILGQVNLPTGSQEFGSDESVPAATLLTDLSLSETLGLGANLGLSGFASDVEEQLFVSLTPSLSFPDHPSLGLYGGYAGFFADSGDMHYAEAGITWLGSDNQQLDLNGGVNLESGDLFLGAGLATRWFLGGS